MIKQLASRLVALPGGRQFFSVFLLDVCAKGFPYLLLPIYLRLMSQQEFGLYTYLVYIIVSVTSIMKLGMDTAATKLFYDAKKGDRGVMLFTLNSVVFGFFLVLLLVAFLFSLNEPVLGMVLKDVSFTSTLAVTVWLNIFTGMVLVFLNVYFVISEKVLVFQKFNLARLVAVNVAACLLLYYSQQNAATMRLGIEGLVGILVLLPILYLYVREFRPSFDRRVLNTALRISLPVLLTNMLTISSGLVDKYLIQEKRSMDDLAIYNLALFLALPISLVFSSFHSLWVPKVFKQDNVNAQYTSTQEVFKKLLLAFMGTVAVLWVGVVLAIKSNLITPNYSAINYVFPVVAIAFSLECLSQLYINIVVSAGKTEITFLVNLLVLVIILFLNLWLLPIFGIIATAGIYLLGSVARVFALQQLIKWKLAN